MIIIFFRGRYTDEGVRLAIELWQFCNNEVDGSHRLFIIEEAVVCGVVAESALLAVLRRHSVDH